MFLFFFSFRCGSGAWWYADPQSGCAYGAGSNGFPTCNLNAPYGQQVPSSKGIYWWKFSNGFDPNLMRVSMKVRPVGTRGRYIVAKNYSCEEVSGATSQIKTVADLQGCLAQCTSWSSCRVAIYDRQETCILRSKTCKPPSEGSIDDSVDTHFRMDGCDYVSTKCGPPPTMMGTSSEIIDMPASLSVNYTCRQGYTNAAWMGDWTVLKCNAATGRWEGQWLECKTLCGDVPDLSSSNAILTPNVVIEGGAVILFYECLPDFEWIYGDLTRTCAPPYGAWAGGDVYCNTTRCANPPNLADSWNNFTLPTPAPLSALTKRYTVWNYTCDIGFRMRHNLKKWSTIYCNENKQWVPSVPGECVRKF